MKFWMAAVTLGLVLAGCASSPSPLSARAGAGLYGAAAAPASQAKVREWVLAHSAGTYGKPVAGKPFPDVNSGNVGTEASAFDGKDGEWVAKVADAWFKKAYGKPPVFQYDAAKQTMVLVMTSDDEPVVFVATYDRATGKGRAIGKMALVDLPFEQAQFAALFPQLGDVSEIAPFEVGDFIMKKGVDLKLQSK